MKTLKYLIIKFHNTNNVITYCYKVNIELKTGYTILNKRYTIKTEKQAECLMENIFNGVLSNVLFSKFIDSNGVSTSDPHSFFINQKNCCKKKKKLHGSGSTQRWTLALTRALCCTVYG